MATQESYDAMQSIPAELNQCGALVGAKLPQYLVTLAATLSIFSGGTALGWTAPVLPTLMSENSTIPVTQEQGSWVGSLLPIGALFGALPAGYIADSFGRKRTVLALGVPLLISWIMILSAHTVYILYLARLLTGAALGAICTTVPTYISEISENRIRGTTGSYFQLMLVAGVLYTYVMGAIFGFRALAFLCGLIPLIFTITFLQAPETPIYLLRNGRRKEAEEALRRLRGDKYNLYTELRLMEREINRKTLNTSFKDSVCKKESIKALAITLGLMFFQQAAGINVVIFYSELIFIEAGSTLSPALSTILVGLTQLIFSYVSMMIIDKLGRKILLLASAVIMGLCLGTLGVYFHLKESQQGVSHLGVLPLVAVLVYISGFCIGFGPIPWMMSGEVLPNDIKGVSTGLAVALNWTLAFIVTKSFQDLVDSIGAAKTFWLFAVVCLLAAVFVVTVLIETKGKSLDKIQSELSGRRISYAIVVQNDRNNNS